MLTVTSAGTGGERRLVCVKGEVGMRGRGVHQVTGVGGGGGNRKQVWCGGLAWSSSGARCAGLEG